MKKTKFKDVQGGEWAINLINDLHPDYKDAHFESVETKALVDGEVVTRHRILMHEKDGTTSFVGGPDRPFLYQTAQLAFRDLQTLHKWQRDEL